MKTILFFLFTILIASCAPLNYYSSTAELNKESLEQLNELALKKKLIKAGDRLSIGVHGEDELSIGSVFGVYNSNPVYGKWIHVQEDSSITLPRIGKVMAVGYSIPQLRDSLTIRYKSFLSDPIIDVKIHSHQVSVIGQVIKPGNYSLDNGSMTLAEALADAGGMDFYAGVNDLRLVRDSVSYSIDMNKTSTNVLSSVQIVDGDVLVVPTRRTKSLEKSSSVFIATASIATVIILLFGNK